MSQTNTPLSAGSATPPAPVAAPHGPRERRLRVGHLALAVALVVVGALGTATLVTSVASGDTYLALAQDVDYGTQLTEEHLLEVRMSSPPGVEPIPASARGQVVGLYAGIPLVQGSLLHSDQLEGNRPPGGDRQIVGLTLRRERLPAQAPRPGAEVTLVASPERAGGEDEPEQPRTYTAVVTGVAGEDEGNFFGGSSSSVTIDVAVPTSDAATIAVLAADNRLSVVLGGG